MGIMYNIFNIRTNANKGTFYKNYSSAFIFCNHVTKTWKVLRRFERSFTKNLSKLSHRYIFVMVERFNFPIIGPVNRNNIESVRSYTRMCSSIGIRGILNSTLFFGIY